MKDIPGFEERYAITSDGRVWAFKGFGADWKCIDFQYEIGATYTHHGDVTVGACASLAMKQTVARERAAKAAARKARKS